MTLDITHLKQNFLDNAYLKLIQCVSFVDGFFMKSETVTIFGLSI